MKKRKTGGYGEQKRWTVTGLRAMEKARVRELFTTLEAPEMEEMNGEYEGYLLDHGSYVLHLMSLMYLSNPVSGWWLGKAFKPLGADTGHGYNMHTKRGKVTRGFRMRTEIIQNGFDGSGSLAWSGAH